MIIVSNLVLLVIILNKLSVADVKEVVNKFKEAWNSKSNKVLSVSLRPSGIETYYM